MNVLLILLIILAAIGAQILTIILIVWKYRNVKNLPPTQGQEDEDE
jgi:hypothetical protein